MNSPASWDTEQEINFVRSLGKHCLPHQHMLSPMELRLLYRQAMAKRENWGRIDKQALLAAMMS